MINLTKLVRPVGVVLMGSSYVVLLITFIGAYIDPTKSILVSINSMGEANAELGLLLCAAPFIAVGLWDYLFRPYVVR